MRKRNSQPIKPTGRASTPAPIVLTVTAAVARGADRVLTAFLTLILCFVLLFTGYAMLDTWRIYEGAGVDSALLQYKPQLTVQETGPGFSDLMDLNPDMRGWLTVEGTNIDYPVVQGEDNIRYVNTDVYGNYSLAGSIFLDYRNASDFSDSYCLLYGHHITGDVMFGGLINFRDASYFSRHETAILYTPNQVYTVKLFACLETSAYDGQVFGPGDLSQEEMEALLARLRTESIQFRDIGVTGQDRILAMSTCTEAASNSRTIVFGILTALTLTTEGGA